MVRWWCQLQPSADLAPALLEGQARELGIHAWLVEVEVQGDGALQPSLLLSPLFEAAAQGGPAVGLVLQLRHPLSPRGEAELARGLAGWLARPGALCQAGRPVLLLDGLAGLSHARFGPRRLRLSLQHELRRLGRAASPSLVGPAMDDAWDCYVLSPDWELIAGICSAPITGRGRRVPGFLRCGPHSSTMVAARSCMANGWSRPQP
jgi:hypothetical protein